MPFVLLSDKLMLTVQIGDERLSISNRELRVKATSPDLASR